MSAVPVLQAALWFSMFTSLVVGWLSFSAGTAPEWIVLRAVAAFSALMVLGLIATAVTNQGLHRPPPRPPDGGTSEPHGTLEPEILNAAELQESGYE